MNELDARRFPHKAVWEKNYWIPTWTAIDDDTNWIYGLQTQSVWIPWNWYYYKQLSEVMELLNAHYNICFKKTKNFSGQHDNFDNNVTQNQSYWLYYHILLQQVPHFDAYTVPSLSDDVARDSLIHIPAEDELEVAKLPFQLKTNKTWQWGWKPGKTSYRSSDRIFKTKWTLYTKWHTLASQSANTELAQASLAVKGFNGCCTNVPRKITGSKLRPKW